MAKKQHTTIAELIHDAEIELRMAEGNTLERGRADGTLAAAMIVQAIDRLVRAVNRNTAAINYSNDNVLEDRDVIEADAAIAREQAQ
jgi:hypothetical protein